MIMIILLHKVTCGADHNDHDRGADHDDHDRKAGGGVMNVMWLQVTPTLVTPYLTVNVDMFPVPQMIRDFA